VSPLLRWAGLRAITRYPVENSCVSSSSLYSDTEQLKVVFAAVEESILKAAIEDLVRNRESPSQAEQG
jgi:hypothetical protein